jgi:hypothetical protein
MMGQGHFEDRLGAPARLDGGTYSPHTRSYRTISSALSLIPRRRASTFDAQGQARRHPTIYRLFALGDPTDHFDVNRYPPCPSPKTASPAQALRGC